MSGRPANRVAYENAKQAIEAYIAQLETVSSTTGAEIRTFVDEYANTNPEITALHSQLKDIKEDTPVLQDRYETEKRASDAVTTTDVSMYYIKGVVAVALLSIVLLVSAV